MPLKVFGQLTQCSSSGLADRARSVGGRFLKNRVLSLRLIGFATGWVAFLAVALLPSGGRAVSAGTLDTSFNVSNKVTGSIQAMALQPDGKVIIGGGFSYYDGVWRQGLARVNADASLDLGFDPGNLVATSVRALFLYPNGKVLVAGGFSGGGRNRIARLNSNGTLDPSFDPGAGPNSDVFSLVVQPDGKIVIGGIFTSVAGQSHVRLARLYDDGTLDTNFVASADNDVHALILQPDGKLIVGGWFSHLNGTSSAFLARLDSAGGVDMSFVSSLGLPVECVDLQSNGRVLAGGLFAFSNGATLARVMPGGSLDIGFSAAITSWVQAVRVQEDGRVLIGGAFTTVNGISRPYMARLYSDGSTDPSFSATIDNTVNGIVIQPDGRFIVSGGFGTVEGVHEQGLARLFGDDQSASPSVYLNGTAFRAYQSDASVTIPVFRSGNTNLSVSVQYATSDLEAQAGPDYVSTSGTLNFAAGEVARSITVPLLNDGEIENSERFSLRLTNAVGGTLGASTNATITVLGVNSVVQIVTPDLVANELAGQLTLSLSRQVTNLTSSVLCSSVDGTALAGVHFSNLAQTVTFAPGQLSNTVTLTLLDDTNPGPDRSFTVKIDNPANTQIGARSNMTIVLIDNDAAGHPAFGLNGNVNALAASGDGSVILGGSFISINGTPRYRLGKVLDGGKLDHGFDSGTGLDSAVSALLAQADGKIVCGGSFTSFSGVPRNRIVRVNADGSLDNSFTPGIGANSLVRALAPAPEGGFYAAGSFTSYGGVARLGLARINANGSLNTNFVPQIPPSSFSFNPRCVATQSDGRVLVGADSNLGNTNILLRLNPDGSRDTTFTNSISISFVNAQINSLAVQPDGKLLVGGRFSLTGAGITRLNTNGSPDSTFIVSNGVSGGTILKLLLLTNGQMIAVGSFTIYAGKPRSNIVRINSNGSIDLSFASGVGADSSILDIVQLPGDRFAIGGLFRKFASFPRYSFAILDSSGLLMTRVEIESFAVSTTELQLGIAVEPEMPFQVLSASDLKIWQLLYTNQLHTPFTNLFLPKPADTERFFRILQTR